MPLLLRLPWPNKLNDPAVVYPLVVVSLLLCSTLCNPMDCSMLGFLVLHYLPVCSIMPIKSVMPSNHLIICHPLFLLPPDLSQHQGLFQWVGSSHQVAKVLELQHQSSQWIGLISFRSHWFNLLASHGTLKSLLEHHSSKASILWHSAFFMVQLSNLYMTTGKTIALTRQIFISKMMSLLWPPLSLQEKCKLIKCLLGIIWKALKRTITIFYHKIS